MTRQPPPLKIFEADEANAPQLLTALREREAELAAGVPVAIRPEESKIFAGRLEAILGSAATAVGCSAAGLYMLDEGTSCLKLRASFGLPPDRLLAAPRPLVSAIADLEALVGHAVVLEDTRLLPHWKCPEDFAGAACVPVSSPTTPLGTLWVFCEQTRDLSALETNLLECVAGRIAAELEREMLLASAVAEHRHQRERAAARDWQQSRLPTIAPLLEGYEVAGHLGCGDDLPTAFFDWSVLADGRLAMLSASSHERGLAGMLAAASLQSSIRSHWNYPHTAAQLLARVGETLWTGSAGDHFASLGYLLLDPESHQIEIGRAGHSPAIVVADGQSPPKVQLSARPPLGSEPETAYQAEQASLPPGGCLVVASFQQQVPATILDGAATALAAWLRKPSRQPLSRLLDHLNKELNASGPSSLTVLRRFP